MDKAKVGAGAGAAAMVALAITYITPTIRSEEGTKYHPYRDVGDVLTVCSGSTGPDVVVGKVYSEADCERLTEADVRRAADGVIKVSPQLINHPMQLASAISFSYNVGVGTYERSSVARDFNAGNYQKGCNDLLKYDHAAGKFSQGLANRRQREWKICMSTINANGDTRALYHP